MFSIGSFFLTGKNCIGWEFIVRLEISRHLNRNHLPGYQLCVTFHSFNTGTTIRVSDRLLLHFAQLSKKIIARLPNFDKSVEGKGGKEIRIMFNI